MKKQQHQKHANIARAKLGYFGRNEWAILGTPCGSLQNLALRLTKELSKQYTLAYVDADHKAATHSEASFLATGAMVYTDKISHHQFELEATLESYQYRNFFNEKDIVLVNGNHFKAQNQLVVIDPKKFDSLERKLDRLTNVQMFLLSEGVTTIPDFLKNHLASFEKIPVYSILDIDKISAFIFQQMKAALPPIKGLVLAGGKSQRMGQDKGLLQYHGKPQQEHIADLLAPLCEQVYLSCRPAQMDNIQSSYSLLPDSFQGLGPFGGIVSAFRQYPDAAWFVVACDLPLLEEATLSFLQQHRNASKVASCFQSPLNEFPEPLISIWEPRSYPILLQFLAQGYSCPRKVLINSNIEQLQVPNPESLMNVNRPEEYEKVKTILKNR